MTRSHFRIALTAAAIFFGGGASSATAQCHGDCNLNDEVTLGEVMTNADTNADGVVRINEVMRSVRSYLVGCPTQPPTPTPTATAPPVATLTFTATAPPVTMTPTPIPPSATPTSAPATATPTIPPSTTPTEAADLQCGNGLLDAGETCTSCAADCAIRDCTPSGQTVSLQAFFSAGSPITAVAIDLAYRSDQVQLPGTANAQTVRARITGLPAGGQSIINDRDYSVRIVKSRTEPLPEGLLFNVEFDLCNGAAAPAADDVSCVVASCSDEFSLAVSDCLCTIIAP